MRSVENDFSADRLFLSSNRKKTQGVKSINPRRDSQLDECAEKRGINSLSLYVAATYEDNVENKVKCSKRIKFKKSPVKLYKKGMTFST